MTDTQSRSDPIEDLHSTSVGHYYEFACDYHKNRDFGNAIAFCERQLAADPHHFPAALLLGELYVENRNLELAVKYAKIAYEIDPSSKVREMLVAALAPRKHTTVSDISAICSSMSALSTANRKKIATAAAM